MWKKKYMYDHGLSVNQVCFYIPELGVSVGMKTCHKTQGPQI